jgi:hypothetical protein
MRDSVVTASLAAPSTLQGPNTNLAKLAPSPAQTLTVSGFEQHARRRQHTAPVCFSSSIAAACRHSSCSRGQKRIAHPHCCQTPLPVSCHQQAHLQGSGSSSAAREDGSSRSSTCNPKPIGGRSCTKRGQADVKRHCLSSQRRAAAAARTVGKEGGTATGRQGGRRHKGRLKCAWT